jgi:hypothetical protein
MQNVLANLVRLRTLDIRVYAGVLTTALNALPDLRVLTIYHICMASSLPTYWLTSWSNLEVLRITKDPSAYFYAPGGTSPRAECGLVGPIPTSWANKEYAQLSIVDLSHNRLSGSLPSRLINGWEKLTQLLLQQNQLTGAIPADWADTPTQTGSITFDFSDNRFQVG